MKKTKTRTGQSETKGSCQPRHGVPTCPFNAPASSCFRFRFPFRLMDRVLGGRSLVLGCFVKFVVVVVVVLYHDENDEKFVLRCLVAFCAVFLFPERDLFVESNRGCVRHNLTMT